MANSASFPHSNTTNKQQVIYSLSLKKEPVQFILGLTEFIVQVLQDLLTNLYSYFRTGHKHINLLKTEQQNVRFCYSPRMISILIANISVHQLFGIVIVSFNPLETIYISYQLLRTRIAGNFVHRDDAYTSFIVNQKTRQIG